MKLMTIFLFFFSSLIVLAGGGEKYKIQKDISHIKWIGKKVTGSHEGTVNVKEGEISIENGNVINGIIYLDMKSILVTDIEDEKSNAKLLKHLVSPSFFDVNEHPVGILKIDKVELQNDNQYIIFGNLTLKEITKRVEIPATILMEEDKVVAIGETEIDRTEFDIRYGSNSFFDNLGDKAIHDNFVVKFKVGAVK